MCLKYKPKLKDRGYALYVYSPSVDEFYIKVKNGVYFVIYKNIFYEDFETGWSKMKVVNNDESKFVLDSNIVYQSLGSYNSIGNGDGFENVKSKNHKENMYLVDDFYNKYSFKQYQKVTLLKQEDGTLLVDCKAYMEDLDKKNNYSGIFYGVCKDGDKIFFKKIS